MCRGLAIITEKVGKNWIVYAKVGESSHDKLLHELRDDLRYGIAPHLKFEVIFPNQIRDDISQDINYPDKWIVTQWNKKIACPAAFSAVSNYLTLYPELTQFTSKMMRGADLRGANLIRTNLREADLREADLREADLRGADLTGANLGDANLTGANLRDADLTKANLRDADLTKANLGDADLTRVDLREADLIGANLRDADLTGANLRGADLTGVDLTATKTKNTIFSEG
jgi:hypothetical protein